MFLDIIKSIIFGIVEGITEWLPISSTGHLILVEQFLKFENVSPEFWSMFQVVIQLGAILAVVLLYFKKIWPITKNKEKAIKTTGKAGLDAYAGDITVMANIIIEISDEGIAPLPEEEIMELKEEY